MKTILVPLLAFAAPIALAAPVLTAPVLAAPSPAPAPTSASAPSTSTSPGPSPAPGPNIVAELSSPGAQRNHQFTLSLLSGGSETQAGTQAGTQTGTQAGTQAAKQTSSADDKPYRLALREAGRPERVRELSRESGERLRREWNRLAWESAYRRPSSEKKDCREYARVAADGERAVVCAGSSKLLGRTYGMLNQLRAYFR